MLAQKPPGVRVAMRDNWTVLVHAMLESADAFGAKTPALAKLAASLEDDDDDDDADDDDDDDLHLSATDLGCIYLQCTIWLL